MMFIGDNIDECNEEINLNHGVGLDIEEYKIRKKELHYQNTL